MPSANPRTLLLQQGKLLRHYPRATGPQRRALEALNKAGDALERADRASLAAAKRLRQAERLLAARRERLVASLLRLPKVGRSAAALARLSEAELLRLARGQRGEARLASRAQMLRWTIRHLALCRRQQARAQAELDKRVRAFQAARARLADEGL